MQFDELRNAQQFAENNIDGGYEILPAVHPSWKSSTRRMLFVIESMDSIDIKRGRLFSRSSDQRGNEQNAMLATFRNVLEQSWLMFSEYRGTNTLLQRPEDPDFSIACVNFNAMKYFHTKGQERSSALTHCARRASDIIRKLRPTDLVIFGDTAAKYLMQGHPYADFLPLMRGVPVQLKLGDLSVTATHTLDLEPLYSGNRNSDEDDEDDGDLDNSSSADLLYYVCRALTHAYNGKHLHDLSYVTPNAVLVDTVAKFDKFYAMLLAHPADKPLGFDSETRGLEAYANKFLCQQYAFSDKRAFLLPIRHKDTPFSEEELTYVEDKLRSFWAARKRSERKFIVGMNLQFDFKVLRAQYNIRTIYHTAWDVTAGEQLLDENLALFDRLTWRVGTESIKTTMGNLQAIACSYGNVFYPTASRTEGGVGKDTRNNIGHLPLLTHKGTQNYCVQDAQIVVALYGAQLERAARIRITKSHCYDKWFRTHVANQMSNTVHALSHMHQVGSQLDTEYLDFLLSKQSPLIKVKKEVESLLRKSPAVQKLNAMLLKAVGASSGGLFSGTAADTGSNVFQINKPDHKTALFFDVLGLKPVAFTDTGKPSVGKALFNAYRLLYPEVDLMEQWQKASKLLGTYVVGWKTRLTENLDSIKDMCLRPSFGFFGVVTGRLNSFKPSLQQIPQHGANAKYVKRAFVAPLNTLSIKWDFSAAEVRKAACVAFDDNLAEAFRVGQKLRQQYIQAPTEALAKELKTKGDVHIANVFRFFGKWVDKKHPLRQAIKAVVFGVNSGAPSW